MKKQKTLVNSSKSTLWLSAILIGAITLIFAPYARASIQSQINQLEAENSRIEKRVLSLQETAASYEDAIYTLNNEIQALNGQIDANQKKQNNIKHQIAEAKKKLKRNKSLLSISIRNMYIEGDISTLEMLATSQNLGDFFEKQEYREQIQDQIKTSLDEIAALKEELSQKNKKIKKLIKEQEQQQAALFAKKTKQTELLSYNNQQQAEFNARVERNQKRIEELIELQRLANLQTDGGYYFLRFPGEVNDFNPYNYPYRDAGFSMQEGSCSPYDGWPDSPDKWGYCTRQCVSYTAWAVEASGRDAPYGYGNAKDWVTAARNNGIPVYRTPKAGDIAISTSGFWGHSMYVESVSGNTFTTSEYNTHLNGSLNFMTRSF